MPAQRNVASYLDPRIGDLTIPTGPSCHVFVAYSPQPTDLDEPLENQLPKKGRSHAKTKPANHIPRPPNAFFLFRSMSAQTRQIAQELGPEVNQQSVVGRLKIIWRNMGKEEKEVWNRRAAIVKVLHGIKYPNYKYKPQRRGKNEKRDKKGKCRQTSPGTGILTPPSTPEYDTSAMDDFHFSPSFLANPGSVNRNYFCPTTTATSASVKSIIDSKCIDPALLKPSPMNNPAYVFQMQSQQYFNTQDLLSPPLSSSLSPSPSELSPTSSSSSPSSWEAVNQPMMYHQMNSNMLPPGAPLLRSAALPNIPYGSQMAVSPLDNNYGLITPPPSGSFSNNSQLPFSSDDALLHQRLAELNLKGHYPNVGGNYYGGNVYSNSLGLINYNPNPGMGSFNGYQQQGHINATDVVNSIYDGTFVPFTNYNEPVHTVAGQNIQMSDEQSTNGFANFSPAANSEDTFAEMMQLAKEFGLVADDDVPINSLNDSQSIFNDPSLLELLNVTGSGDNSSFAAAYPGFPGQHMG